MFHFWFIGYLSILVSVHVHVKHNSQVCIACIRPKNKNKYKYFNYNSKIANVWDSSWECGMGKSFPDRPHAQLNVKHKSLTLSFHRQRTSHRRKVGPSTGIQNFLSTLDSSPPYHLQHEKTSGTACRQWSEPLASKYTVSGQSNIPHILIDHIVANAPNNISSFSVPHYSISDHLTALFNTHNSEFIRQRLFS